jgi:hypothetical protein
MRRFKYALRGLLTLSLLVLITSPGWGGAEAASVTELWASRYDEDVATEFGTGQQVLVDDDHNVYMIGRVWDTSTVRDLLIARYDSRGNLLWDQRIPDRWVSSCESGWWGSCGPRIDRPSRSAALDSSGQLVVAAESGFVMKFDQTGGKLWESDASLDVGQAVQLFAAGADSSRNIYVSGMVGDAAPGKDALLIKYAPDGRLLWYVTFEGPDGEDQLISLQVADDGSIYCGGVSRTPDWSHWSALYLRYSSSGSLLFSVVDADLGPNFAIDIDASGNLYATGWVSPHPIKTYVAKYDSSGTQLWATVEPGWYAFSPATPWALRADRTGNLYVAGTANVNGFFQHYLILKYGPDGVKLWERDFEQYGDSAIFAMTLDEGVEPIVTGEFGYCYGRIRTMKLSPDGQVLWSVSYQPPAYECASLNYGISIAMDSNRSIYVAGHSHDATSGVRYQRKATLIKYGQPVRVDIDIKPGSDPNSINLSAGGTVAVAILSRPDFDATRVDPLTATLAGAPVVVAPGGAPMAAAEDVDGDDRLDLVVHVRTANLQLDATSTEAYLSGQTFDSKAIEGSDTVNVIHR